MTGESTLQRIYEKQLDTNSCLIYVSSFSALSLNLKNVGDIKGNQFLKAIVN